MGLLESTSSILITGQSPLNGIWFAMKGQRGAVSCWTHLSFETSTPTHTHPLLWPLQLTAGVWITPRLFCSCGMDGCVLVRGWSVNRQIRRGRGSVPWEMLFVSYWSLLGGLDWLKGWTCNSLSHWKVWKWIQSRISAALSTPMSRDDLSETE